MFWNRREKMMMEEIEYLKNVVGLLQQNQYSDVSHWWDSEHGCYLRKKHDLFCSVWQYRYPFSPEWNIVGPDFTEAIAEIEAEEAK